jgi:hypothetical protein
MTSVELIVQPGANNVVSEMRVRGDPPPDRRSTLCRGVWIVERAEVYIKLLYFVGPTGNQQLALRTGAHRPTGVNLRMTIDMGN